MNKTIATILSFILATGLTFFLVLPKYELLQSKTAEERTKESNLDNMNDYYKKAADISAELENYQEELAKIDFALPGEISLPRMYRFFQERASEAGLVLKNETADQLAASKTAGLNEQAFSLELTGSYTAFKNFLGIMEKSARLIEIEGISFGSPEKGKELFSFSVLLKFYSY